MRWGESVFDIRPVLFANGLLLVVLAGAMGVPLLLDLAQGGTEAAAFAAGLAITGFFGAALALSGRGRGPFGLGTRQAFLFGASGTVLAGLFCALPLMLGSRHLPYVDAVFEAVSGITTTGATVLTGLDHAPAALLLWRALLQWLGGAGLIVAALALLPILRIGGMQIFRVEGGEGRSGKASPRLPRLVGRLLAIYLSLTLLMIMALRFAGMTPLEAVCHAMSTLSTGGFSTSDRSLGAFSDSARWVCAVGMIFGGANLSLLTSRWRGRPWRILRDTQVRWYMATMLGFTLILTFWYWAVEGRRALAAFQHAGFQAVSVISTTGFRLSDDYVWGGFPQVAIFVMSFIGGCTGSAAGGIKIFRYEVLFAVSRLHVVRMLYPHGVFSVSFNRFRLPEAVLRSVLGYFMLYFICFAALAVGLAAVGLDPLSSLSAAAAAIGNVGRGIGPVIGAAGGYAMLPAAAKWLLSVGMLMGRLELVPLLLPFFPAFWKH